MMTPLLLVDGHHLLFRAHYGFPARITSRDGARDLTGVFGFFALLRVGIRDNLDPAPETIVVFDVESGVAKRRAIEAGYKTHRSAETPAPIVALADIKRGLDICGIDWIELEDQEADDVIGTLVTITRRRQRHVVVMSGDRDFYQLLGTQVRILNTARRAGQRLIGPQVVAARYGVTAAQWCDFRALTGDPADGIPGIWGIGPKTAARLLHDGLVLEDLPFSGRLTGRTGKAVLQAREQLITWRGLIRLRTDIRLSLHPSGSASPPLPPAPGTRHPAPEIVERLRLW